jgi:antitoxin PrlF
MAELKVTAKGQVTLRKDVLKHLGVRPGDKIQLDVLPNGKVELKAVCAKEGWDRLFGLLAGKTKKVVTIEEMNDAIERGWAGLP